MICLWEEVYTKVNKYTGFLSVFKVKQCGAWLVLKGETS